MRFTVRFRAKKLPMAYQFLFLSLMKKSVANSDPSFKEEQFQPQISKPFTHSVFLRGYELNKVTREFEISDMCDWHVTFHDPTWALHFYNGILQEREWNYQGYMIEIDHISMQPMQKLENNHRFRTMSPILLYTKDKEAVSPYDARFNEELQYMTTLACEQFYGRQPHGPVTLQPIDMQKVVRQMPRKRTENVPVYIESWKGTFSLDGHPDDVKLLYEIGIGFRRAQGYGMVATA